MLRQKWNWPFGYLQETRNLTFLRDFRSFDNKIIAFLNTKERDKLSILTIANAVFIDDKIKAKVSKNKIKLTSGYRKAWCLRP